jgi:hypothetical protein
MMIVATVAGTALDMAGAIKQGNDANAMAEAQAKAQQAQAMREQKASAFEQVRERRKQDLLAANARAQVGASGVAFEGSPSTVLAANTAQGELDIQAIQYGSTLRQNQLHDQAAITRMGGKQAQTSGWINAGSAFVSGVSQLYDPNKAAKFGGSAFSRNTGGMY